MRTTIASSLVLSLGLLAGVHCGSFDGDDVAPGAADGGDVVAPPGCDPAADPKDATACVVDGFGVFVDASSGADSNPGTKAAPFKSIAAAATAAAGKRVYVCEGSYDKVKLTSPASIFGGFACGTWVAGVKKPEVTAPAGSYPLEIAKVAGDVLLSDLRFVAANATDDGGSSIAAFVVASPKVSFVRVELQAGNGKDGKDGTPGKTDTLASVSGGGLTYDGRPANGDIAGPQKVCTCTTTGTSTGGSGGGPEGDGVAGKPAQATSGGGLGKGATVCSGTEPDGNGNNGAAAPAAADAPKPTAEGQLSEAGWAPTSGATGAAGSPGQGGGGGGGRNTTAAGGGGACGGCGGTAGTGGQGGGASLALVALDSGITLRETTLAAGAGGNGGAGKSGGDGADGGSGGLGNCQGGEGGKGGKGGSGAGGAGGLSVGVLYKGSKPTLTNTIVTTGSAGVRGIGGTPDKNDGPEGKKTDLLEAP